MKEITAAGCQHEKNKPEPIPVMDYRQYRRARRLVHECCNYTTETVSRWMMGRNVSVSSLFPTPCCAGGFGRRYCRRIRNWKRRCSTG